MCSLSRNEKYCAIYVEYTELHISLSFLSRVGQEDHRESSAMVSCNEKAMESGRSEQNAEESLGIWSRLACTG